METAARQQTTQLNNKVELVKVRAIRTITLTDMAMDPNPTVILPGEVFWVNLTPMEGLNGLGAHFKGESFFVEANEWVHMFN